MALKDDLKAYQAGWLAVAEIEKQEMQVASIELKWQQLNSIIGLAIELGILKADKSEEEIYKRWAKLKENTVD